MNVLVNTLLKFYVGSSYNKGNSHNCFSHRTRACNLHIHK